MALCPSPGQDLALASCQLLVGLGLRVCCASLYMHTEGLLHRPWSCSSVRREGPPHFHTPGPRLASALTLRWGGKH
jgi:hypothetical protein